MTTIRTTLGASRDAAVMLRNQRVGNIVDTNVQDSLETIDTNVTAIISELGTVRVVTEAGDVTATNDDGTIIVNKDTPEDTNLYLPDATNRKYRIVIKDGGQVASTHPITVLPADGSGKTIDGLASVTINIDGAAWAFTPLTDGNWIIG